MAKEKNSSESIKFVYISKIPKKVSIILKSGSHHKIKHLFFVGKKKNQWNLLLYTDKDATLWQVI